MTDYTQHSALFPGGRWLLCRPTYFDVTYEINAWMHVGDGPNKSVAKHQWQVLHHTLLRNGAWIDYVEPQPDVPDMVFTANAGLVRGKKVVLARFKHPERQKEEKFFRAWFEENGFTVLYPSDLYEGEGDSLFAGTKLFCGYGFRSNANVYEEVAGYVTASKVILCEMIDPRFYHLDTCFAPLNATTAVFYPGAFTTESIRKMEQEIELIPIKEADAKKFACNMVVLGKEIVLPAGCDDTVEQLHGRGYRCFPVLLDQYLKSGGAAKCLTLKIDRE